MFHFPTHPNVISDVFDVGCAMNITWMSMRKEAYHKSKASPSELVAFRFFMIPKEVHNMATTLQTIENAMVDVDWSLMMQDTYAFKDLGKVAHV